MNVHLLMNCLTYIAAYGLTKRTTHTGRHADRPYGWTNRKTAK